MTSWVVAVILGGISVSDPGRVSLELPGVSLEGFCERLSAETGVDYSVEDRLKREMVAIRVEGMEVEELKGYVGDVVYGRWVPEGGGQKLVFDEGWVEREKRDQESELIEKIREAKEFIRFALAGQGSPKSEVAEAVFEVLFSSFESPGSRAFALLLLKIPDDVWMRCLQAERGVLSTQARGVQYDLDIRPVQSLLTQWIQSENQANLYSLKEEANNHAKRSEVDVLYGAIDSYSTDRIGFQGQIQSPPLKYILELRGKHHSDLGYLDYRASLTAFDAEGKAVLHDQIDLGEIRRFFKHATEGESGGGQYVDRFEELIAKVQDDSPGQVLTGVDLSEEEKARLSDIEIRLSQPGSAARLIEDWAEGRLEAVPSVEGKAMVAYSERVNKPIVACLSGAIETDVTQWQDRPIGMIEFKGFNRSEPLVKNGVLLGRIGLEVAGRQHFGRWQELVRLLDEIASSETLTFDQSSRVQFDLDHGRLEHESPFDVEQAMPKDLKRFILMADYDFQDIWGGLTQDQQTSLRNGGRVYFRDLRAELKSVLTDLYFKTPEGLDFIPERRPRLPWEVEPWLGCGNGYVTKEIKDWRDEPTEVMPFGIPEGAFLQAQTSSQDMVEFVQEDVFVPYLTSAEEIAFSEAYDEYHETYEWSESEGPDLCRVARVGKISLQFVVSPDVGSYVEAIDSIEPISAPFEEGQYPQSFRKLIDEARSKMMQSPVFLAREKYWQASARERAGSPTR